MEMGLQSSLHLLDTLEILRRSWGICGDSSPGQESSRGLRTVAGEWGRMSSLDWCGSSDESS